MYSEVPAPDTEYGAELLTDSIRCGVTFAMGKIDGIVVVDKLGPLPVTPLIVVRTIPVMVLPPPDTIEIEFWPPASVAIDTGIPPAFLPPASANGIGMTVVVPEPPLPEFDTDKLCGPPMTWPWLTVTICDAGPTEPAALTFTICVWLDIKFPLMIGAELTTICCPDAVCSVVVPESKLVGVEPELFETGVNLLTWAIVKLGWMLLGIRLLLTISGWMLSRFVGSRPPVITWPPCGFCTWMIRAGMVLEMLAVDMVPVRFCVPTAPPEAIVVNTVGARTGTCGVRMLILPAGTRTPMLAVGRR